MIVKTNVFLGMFPSHWAISTSFWYFNVHWCIPWPVFDYVCHRMGHWVRYVGTTYFYPSCGIRNHENAFFESALQFGVSSSSL